MGKYFGTDGFRGEANKTLTAEHAFKIGRYLGWYYGKEHRCKAVIGKDTRRSSYMFEYALCAGLTSSGADAYLLHVTTTPSVSYIARTEDFDFGVMISASHNPYYDNGIKLINSKGEKMSEAILDEIEKYIDGEIPEIPLALGKDIGRTVDYSEGRNRYTGYIISLARHSYKNLRIGLDSSNGSTWMLAKSIFDTLGAKTYCIGNSPDGININENCGSTHIESLCELVKKENLDIGFAFDGDADRCLAVDSDGKVLTGDHILYFCSKYMKEKGELEKNTIAATVMSNLGLFKSLEEMGIECQVTDVGDKFVYEAMTKGGFCLGGEESGHIIFSKFASTGDGLITALKIMETFIESKCPSSKLSDGFTLYPQLTVNVRVKDKNAALSNPNVQKAKEKIENELSGNGRILVRKSGTEPLLRVMVEAETKEKCEKFSNYVADVIRENESE
ncbi:MAG: phosphoglucosamine mutase [Ruminococcaceae bacterium]|nr:phosphoglucosamine mutase [Oscillospiraceae bacterium]